jgi:hypothetical protein
MLVRHSGGLALAKGVPMATFFRRIGICSWCGQCCGAIYFDNPDPKSPWPRNWPWVMSDWTDEALEEHSPFGAVLFRYVETQVAGVALIGGIQFRFIVIPDIGIVTDKPPYGNPSQYFDRCPFLVLHGEQNVPPTECGVATHRVFTGHCVHLPHEIITEIQHAEWIANHNACSYTWEPFSSVPAFLVGE